MKACFLILLLHSLPFACMASRGHSPARKESPHVPSRSIRSLPIAIPTPRVADMRRQEVFEPIMQWPSPYHLPTPPELYPSRPRREFEQQMPEVMRSPISPEEIHVVEVKAHASEVRAHAETERAISKRKIACLMAASSITAAALTAAVTLTVHFTACK